MYRSVCQFLLKLLSSIVNMFRERLQGMEKHHTAIGQLKWRFLWKQTFGRIDGRFWHRKKRYDLCSSWMPSSKITCVDMDQFANFSVLQGFIWAISYQKTGNEGLSSLLPTYRIDSLKKETSKRCQGRTHY